MIILYIIVYNFFIKNNKYTVLGFFRFIVTAKDFKE